MMMWWWWLIPIVVVILGIYLYTGKNKNSRISAGGESALGILEKRYAKGEITKEEFEQQKETINSKNQ